MTDWEDDYSAIKFETMHYVRPNIKSEAKKEQRWLVWALDPPEVDAEGNVVARPMSGTWEDWRQGEEDAEPMLFDSDTFEYRRRSSEEGMLPVVVCSLGLDGSGTDGAYIAYYLARKIINGVFNQESEGRNLLRIANTPKGVRIKGENETSDSGSEADKSKVRSGDNWMNIPHGGNIG